MPSVSIVLPTWNRIQYLAETVASIRAQTFGDWELLIADDGSDSQFLKALSTLERAPQIRILRLAHSGNPPAVRNAALAVRAVATSRSSTPTMCGTPRSSSDR